MLATVVLTPSISDLYFNLARSSLANRASFVASAAFTRVSHLLDVLLAHSLLLRQLVEDSLLILGVFKLYLVFFALWVAASTSAFSTLTFCLDHTPPT